jgi:hypothetical protein
VCVQGSYFPLLGLQPALDLAPAWRHCMRLLARLTVLESEVILGRDIVNRLKMLLDGPRLRVRPSASRRVQR